MANEFVAPTFDSEFVIGVSSDAELDEGLNQITANATAYSNAINVLPVPALPSIAIVF